MLDIHDIVEYCTTDLKRVECDLKAIDKKLKTEEEIRKFTDYLNDENDAFM